MRARLTRRWSKDASKGARLVCFGHRFPLLLPIVRKERFLDLVHTEMDVRASLPDIFYPISLSPIRKK